MTPARSAVARGLRWPSVLEEARDLGFLGPGPIDVPPWNTRAVPRRSGWRRLAKPSISAPAAACPGSCWRPSGRDLAWTFLDAMAKRTAFLERAVAALGLPVTVLTGRAEELGRRGRRSVR